MRTYLYFNSCHGKSFVIRANNLDAATAVSLSMSSTGDAQVRETAESKLSHGPETQEGK